MSGRPPSRTIPTARCSQCSMRCELCVCSFIPRLATTTKLLLITHRRELLSTTNTGRIAHAALVNSEIRIRGDKNSPMSTEGFMSADYETLFLYPSEDATALTPSFASTLPRPVQLIVPDGTWRQAHKVMNRVAELKNIRKIKLDAQAAPTIYRLRQKPHSESLATLEAIARAFGVLESKHVQSQLEAVLQIMVKRTLWTRGQVPGISLDELLSSTRTP